MLNLHPYLPQDRLRALARGAALPEHTSGAALFADISGFTPLFEALAEQLGPQRAAEEMTRLLGQVYDSLVHQVEQQRGSVIDFVGDAITCWFDDADLSGARLPVGSVMRAATAALAMQRAMVPFAAVDVLPGVRAALTVKIGIACGAARRFVVGDPAMHQMDVLAGAPLRAMSQAEGMAQRGEIVLAPAARAALQSAATPGEIRVHPEEGREFAVLQSLAAPADANPWPVMPATTLDAVQLRPWILAPLYARLRRGNGEARPELRPVVALFLRFTGIDYDRDPDASAKLDAFIRHVQRTAARYAGDLLQVTIGDKGSFLYIVFGALAAHDDDAFRAVRAAEGLLALPDSLRFLTLQIGLASGPARTGAYGSVTRRSYGAIGSDVVLAARLMTAAPPGEMRCSYSIYRQVRDNVAFESLPPVRLKGRVGLIRVYRPAVGKAAQPTSPPTLIGRRAEAAVLAQVLDAVKGGAPRVVIIEGEAGIGKSHLVELLKHMARERGLTGLIGNGQSIEQQTPYRAWREVFTSYFHLEDVPEMPARRARVAALAPQLTPEHAARWPVLNDILGLELPETALTQSLDANLRQQNVTLVATALLQAWTDERPLVLILDDVHWLDELSWQLVQQVIRSLTLRNAPFLCVLVSRPLPETGIGRAVFAELRAQPFTRELALTSLTAEDIHALMAHRLRVPVAALPAPLIDLVTARANGNPFFAEELVFHLRDTGLIEAVEGAEAAPATCRIRGDLETAQRALPHTLHGLILARLDRQPAERQFILKVAAVLGRSFTYAPLFYTLNRYATTLETVLRTHLTALQAADFTFLETLEPELTYMFKHIITQEAAYQTLLFAQRRDLHRTAAAWYEAHSEAHTFWPLLAYHYRYAEDVEKEIHYLKLAGAAAEKVFANEAAIDFYTRLLTLLPDDQDKFALYLQRGQVLELMGQWEEAESDYRAALAFAHDTVEKRARAQFALGKLNRQRGAYEAALNWLAQAKEIQPVSDNSDRLAKLLIETGIVLCSQGNYAEARARLNEGLTLAQETDDLVSVALARNNLGIVVLKQGNYAEARTLFEESLSLRREMDDKWGISASLNNLGMVALNLGDYGAARAMLEESLNLHREMGDKQGVAGSLQNLGVAALKRGDYVEARALYEESLSLRREMGDKQGIAVSLNNLGLVASNQGDYAAARALYEESLSLKREMGDRHGISSSLNNLGNVALSQGDYVEARVLYEECLILRREMGNKRGIAESFNYLGYLNLLQGDTHSARAMFVESLTLNQEMGLKSEMIWNLIGPAAVSGARGNNVRAVHLAAAAETLRASVGVTLPSLQRGVYEQVVATTRAALGEAVFGAAWDEGAKLSLDQAIAEALALTEEV